MRWARLPDDVAPGIRLLLSREGAVATAPEIVAWALSTSRYRCRAASRRRCTLAGERSSSVGPWSEGCTSLAHPESVPNGRERSFVDMAVRNARREHCIPGTRRGRCLNEHVALLALRMRSSVISSAMFCDCSCPPLACRHLALLHHSLPLFRASRAPNYRCCPHLVPLTMFIYL